MMQNIFVLGVFVLRISHLHSVAKKDDIHLATKYSDMPIPRTIFLTIRFSTVG